MDEDDDLYGTAGDDAQVEDGTPAVKAENEVDMDGDQDEEEEESDDVRLSIKYMCTNAVIDCHV